MVLAEVAQVRNVLAEAQAAGSPYPPTPGYNFDGYLDAAIHEATCAEQGANHTWPKGVGSKTGHLIGEFMRVWTGSEHETAMAAVHRAENLLLMIVPEGRLRSEALQMEATFQSANDIPISDPRHLVYTALFARIRPPVANGTGHAAGNGGGGAPAPVAIEDRARLQEVRREQNEAWEIARSRVRIFRNILTVTIPFLAVVLAIAAFIGSVNPTLLPLRANLGATEATDVAIVEFLGGLGGLLSAVATLRAARNFQRFYGLPLAQSLLKLPAGAASGLAGVFLLQHGLFGTVATPNWDTVLSYALLFGVAQLAVTKQIDTRAGDLLGEANAKSPSTAQSTAATHPSADA